MKEFGKLSCPGSPFTDELGRTVRYIRLSVTDRCNLRCAYCRSGMETFIPHPSVLRYEEMADLVGMAVEQGVEKIRLTGGEPFARKGFIDFTRTLREKHPELDIRITTNGTMLAPYVRDLKDIGVNAINLSLDTFDRAKFERITGRDLFHKVRDAADSLLAHGIPLKINAVAVRGVNDDELEAFLNFAAANPVDVRFIEFMPMGEETRWESRSFWPAAEILAGLEQLATLLPVRDAQKNAGPARLYAIAGGKGRVGLITPLSQHFCGTCNRLRITSDGRLRTCLFADREYRLREVLRHPRLGLEHVRRIVSLATLHKPLGADILAGSEKNVARRRMTAIGG